MMVGKNNTDILLCEVSKKLDIVIFALACQGKSQEEINNIAINSSLSYPEIAPVLGVSVEALKTRISRMKKKSNKVKKK